MFLLLSSGSPSYRGSFARARRESNAENCSVFGCFTCAYHKHNQSSRILQLLRCSNSNGMAYATPEKEFFLIIPCGRVCCVVVLGVYGEKQRRIVSFRVQLRIGKERSSLRSRVWRRVLWIFLSFSKKKIVSREFRVTVSHVALNNLMKRNLSEWKEKLPRLKLKNWRNRQIVKKNLVSEKNLKKFKWKKSAGTEIPPNSALFDAISQFSMIWKLEIFVLLVSWITLAEFWFASKSNRIELRGIRSAAAEIAKIRK